MLILPYSTALNLGKPPWVSYAAVALCVLVYLLQTSFPLTPSLMYYPTSWNPLTMISSSLAHADFWHLLGNMVFFMAFAPALETLVGSALRTLGIMLFITIVVSISYSLSVIIGATADLPTLGFSGVVMGMIGLSASLMPKARIRVFCWFFVFWKIFFVPAWILAILYIGLDAWTMVNAEDYGGINLVAHVAGGVAGYVYGALWLEDRRLETGDELAEEIEAQRIEQKHGKTRAEAHRYKKAMDPILVEKSRQRDYDKFMGQIYQMVKTHRDSEAVMLLSSRYDLSCLYTELEPVFERVLEWGPSRTLLCLGRLMIQILDRESRYGRALLMIEVCQSISREFVLPDLSRVVFYAEMALDTGKPGITANLVENAEQRYQGRINPEHCRHLLEKARKS